MSLNLFNRQITAVYKVFEFQEIARGISANGKLGENNQVSARFPRLIYAADDLLQIEFKMPDMIVLLNQRNFHGAKLR